MPQAISSDILLFANNTCLIYTGKDIKMIEEQLNTDCSSICDWFIDNKLSVHFRKKKQHLLFTVSNSWPNLLVRARFEA